MFLNRYLAITYRLTTNHKQIQLSAFIYSGALDFNFIDYSFAYKQNIFLILLNMPQTLEAFNGTNSDYRQITHITKIDNFALYHYEKQIVFLYITYFHYHFIILGHP